MSNFNIYHPGDTFDSLDVIGRLEELESVKFSDLTEDEKQELADLRDFEAEVESVESVEDWNHGAMFIADDYFETYAQQFAEDIGAIDREASWPCYHIDWEAAAEDLQRDYTDVEVNGVTYWVR